MAVSLGLLVAITYGSGDYFGGRASRDAPTVGVLFVAQCIALIGAAVVAVVVSAEVGGGDVAFGAVAGVLNAAGLGMLYRGLATGRMGVVAPVTAVVAAVVPIVWGLTSGERPSSITLIGVVVAVGAGGVVAREPDVPDEPPTTDARTALLLALGAGSAFGLSFVCFAETSDGSGYWPLLIARVAAVLVVGTTVLAVARRDRPSVLPRRGPRRLAVAAGVLDVTATVLLLTALREGLVVVVAPMAALAPAFTVIWAWALLKEPITRHQLVGLGLALAGLVLIAAG